MGIPVRYLGDQVDNVPFLDLVDALGPPMGDDVTAQQIRYAPCGAGVRYPFLNERLDQVIDSVDDQTTPRLLLLLGRVSTVEPRLTPLRSGLIVLLVAIKEMANHLLSRPKGRS